MRNHTPTTELAQKERDRAAGYARMTRDDVVEQIRVDPQDVAIAPNGRPYDRQSGRYVDR
jgi:hypothetical protein